MALSKSPAAKPQRSKNQKKTLLAFLLIAMVLSVGAVNIVHGNVVATITVGTGPASVVYDSSKSEIFVLSDYRNQNANGSCPGSVSVISDTRNAVMATIPVGAAPAGLAYDSAKGEVFVANGDLPNDNGTVSNAVSIISDSSNTVAATVPIGFSASTIVYDSGKGEVYVATAGSGYTSNIYVISDTTNTVTQTLTHLGGCPSSSVYDYLKGEIFFGSSSYNGSVDYVFILSDSSNSVIAAVPVGNGIRGLAFDPAMSEVFVANTYDNTVSVISDKTNSVVATIPVGASPNGLAYDQAKGEIFVSNYNSSSISIISDKTNAVIGNIEIGGNKIAPSAMAYDPRTDELFVANYYSYSNAFTDEPWYISNTVLVISASSYSAVTASSSPTASAAVDIAGSASQTPAIPEFPAAAILVMFVGLSLFAVAMLTVRKILAARGKHP